MVPRGRQGPSPFVSSASPRGPLALATSQAAHPKFLAHAANTHLLGLEYFDIDIPFHYHLFSFNLYPIALEFGANALHKFCVVLLMQSAFTIRNMNFTPAPPSPNMAAAAPAKRKFRKCTDCTSRMPPSEESLLLVHFGFFVCPP